MATPIPSNCARLSLGELAAATGGVLVGLESEHEVVGVTTDSRAAGERALFVALRGEHHDGHAFVEPARAAGSVVLVARAAGIHGPRLEVDDPLIAFGAVARAHVDRLAAAGRPTPVLAVGGAAGKTTTKTLAAAAVGALLGETLVTAGNLNNRIGVPATLLTLEPRHRAAVLELGTSEPGEIAALATIARPDVGLVVNVGIEHSEKLGEIESIVDEEATLLVEARRAAVTSADEPLLLERLARVAARRWTFGAAPGADVRLLARELRPDGSTGVRLRLPGGSELEIVSPLLGLHLGANLAAAVAGALALADRQPDEDERVRLAAALGAVEAVPGRLRPLAVGDRLVIDDTYNSNPRSAAAALATARELAAARPRGGLVLALGDMLELGPLAAAAHDELVREADAAGARRLILVGAEIAAAARRVSPTTPTALFADARAAAEQAPRLIEPDDLVLVKGSRGIGTEAIVEALARDRISSPA
jgi:UDP-N-acetylmuramoyl-tripeptide--D-alanyl-D-alanine ligase